MHTVTRMFHKQIKPKSLIINAHKLHAYSTNHTNSIYKQSVLHITIAIHHIENATPEISSHRLACNTYDVALITQTNQANKLHAYSTNHTNSI